MVSVQVQPYISGEEIAFISRPSLFIPGEVGIGGHVEHFQTTDFLLDDPWSELAFRPAIRELAQQGWFDDRDFLELGIGDARNEIEALMSGARPASILGVDTQWWELAGAYRNLVTHHKGTGIPLSLFQADAVDFLEKEIQDRDNQFSGRAIMCLPQSLGSGTAADVVTARPSHESFKDPWGKYGLTLNAAVLGRLGDVSAAHVEALIILSGRIPNAVRMGLFDQTGWKVIQQVKDVRIRQDSDANLDWMLALTDEDDGRRFWDRGGSGISIEQAVGRINDYDGAGELDVFHDVHVYKLGRGI